VLQDGGTQLQKAMFWCIIAGGAFVIALLWLGLRNGSPEAPRSAVTKVLLTVAFVRVAGVVSVSLLR